MNRIWEPVTKSRFNSVWYFTKFDYLVKKILTTLVSPMPASTYFLDLKMSKTIEDLINGVLGFFELGFIGSSQGFHFFFQTGIFLLFHCYSST